jgi:hydroxymethylpyrimidine/phosphomethylpyrimidine kinase
VTKFPIVLTIAGSDSSGGAGIQADLKTFSALGVYGASAITCITAQNTCTVEAIHSIPASMVAAQLKAVFEDLDIAAVKIGMLNSETTIEKVSSLLQHYRPKFIVVDPVMVSTSGKQLIETAAIAALKELILPIATIITPNIPEAAVLLNITPANDRETMLEAVRQLQTLGAESVLLKGGHLGGDTCLDVFLQNGAVTELKQTKIKTNNTHGTGCTLSAAITANLASGDSILMAVKKANLYLHEAIKRADDLNIGKGHGPVHHFYQQW